MQLRVYSKAITTTGSAGAATGSGTIIFEKAGYLEWVYYDFHASAPATTDVSTAFAATPPGGTIFTSTSSTTDVLQFPRGAAVNTAGTAITNSSVLIAVSGSVTVSIAQCDALTDAVTVYVAVVE